ncbi:carbonic anhydrase family protein [Ectothiorhodospiraceae bacterium BW-2]|nr:carbonic anhydrase family protein [Ectothiorhodospiraceae bacterium BW-2]
MTKPHSLWLSSFAILFSSAVMAADGKVNWGYSGHGGPEHWGALSPDYALCSSGKNQSPVNLTGMVEGELPPIHFNYRAGGAEIINNGHTIQINYQPGSAITLAEHTFELKQFHFHTPSENSVEGYHYPMEAHLVHADKEGNLAVIAIMYKAGEVNRELQKAWQQMPLEAGGAQTLDEMIDANQLLPKDRDYYRFNGSLTTPPCSEGVNWLVMKKLDSASQAQLDQFSHTMHHDNNRPIQPLNARLIIQ